MIHPRSVLPWPVACGAILRATILLAVVLFLGPGPRLSAQTRPDALVAYRAGRFQEAVQITLAELSENARNMDAYTVLGWSLNRLGRHQESVTYAERALTVNRNDPRILQIIGEAHYYLRNDLQALRYLQEYTAIVSNGTIVGETYSYIGEILLRLREYHAADIAFTSAVHHLPDRVAFWVRLGFAREQTGDRANAAAAYREALRRNAGNADAQAGLARVSP